MSETTTPALVKYTTRLTPDIARAIQDSGRLPSPAIRDMCAYAVEHFDDFMDGGKSGSAGAERAQAAADALDDCQRQLVRDATEVKSSGHSRALARRLFEMRNHLLNARDVLRDMG